MSGDSQEFPFTKPEGSDAEMFIQWKGTDVCVDFYCPCGQHGHFDGSFAYWLHCPTCGQIYRMGTQVIARKVVDLADMPPSNAAVQTLDTH